MKLLKYSSIVVLFIIFTSALAADRPVATYRVGAAKITVWENERQDGTTWKNFQIEKLYKKNGKWETSNSFDQGELLQLRAAIDKAISEQSVEKE